MNFKFVIQARMGSQRFPGKVLSEFSGKPLLQFQIELLKERYPDFPLEVATSDLSENDAIEKLCQSLNTPCFRGDEENVLSRYIEISEKSEHQIIRLTADNPLFHPGIMEHCIDLHRKQPSDLTSTRHIDPDKKIQRFAPKGLSVDIISPLALQGAKNLPQSAFDKEHVIPIFYRSPFQHNLMKDYEGISHTSYSIDTESDKTQVESRLNEIGLEGLFSDER